MEEVGYLAELLSRGHRPEQAQDEDTTNVMQGAKRPQPATQRRRTPGEEGSYIPEGEELSSSTSLPRPAGSRNTRRDPVPMEENLTAEDWAIMEAVERCPVWRKPMLYPRPVLVNHGASLITPLCFLLLCATAMCTVAWSAFLLLLYWLPRAIRWL